MEGKVIDQSNFHSAAAVPVADAVVAVAALHQTDYCSLVRTHLPQIRSSPYPPAPSARAPLDSVVGAVGFQTQSDFVVVAVAWRGRL